MAQRRSVDDFRAELREFFARNLPVEMARRNRTAVHQTKEDAQAWISVLAKRGWSAPSWPTEFGGPGWSALESYIFEEECMLAGAPWVNIQGVYLIGPVLHAFGTDEQKRRYLPRILDGTEFWAQGFSEPNSGSDLASLRTRAVLDGDEYVIDGQKIWTTGAMDSDMLFCLVRTSAAGRASAGISFILVPTRARGVTVRPIKSLDEGYSLCEVFFESVRVPRENLIGAEGQGWAIARFLLAGERISGADLPRNKRNLEILKEIAVAERSGDCRLIDDPVYANRIAALEIDLMALEASITDIVTNERKYDNIPVASLVKLHGSELMQSLLKLETDALGPYSAAYYPQGDDLAGSEDFTARPAHAANITAEYMYRRASTIYGGSNEIQKNIVSKALFVMADAVEQTFGNEDLQLLAHSVERFIVRNYDFQRRAAIIAGGSDAQRRIWSMFAEQGWLGAALPEELGGLGRGAAAAAIIAERIGRALVLEPYVGCAVLPAKLIELCDRGDRRQALLDAIVSGEEIFGVAHEERGARGRLEHVATRAASSQDGYILSGAKVMTLGGVLCDKLLVSARTGGGVYERAGVSLFLVDVRHAGVTVHTYRTIDQRLVMDVDLDSVRLPADSLVGEEGRALDAVEAAYDHATVALCAESIGAMERAFWTARDYIATRKQFGSALSEFQVLRHRLVDMYVELEMARAIVNSAVSSIDTARPEERRRLVSAAKARVGRAGHFVGGQAIQLHGGIGMTDEYVIGHYFKRLHVADALFGNTHFHTALRASAFTTSTKPAGGQ
ncbi:MAG: acyl-CoA dehydrogenase family protein [Rhizobiales bacterium]|nr:acyl-CoA dehydrogenase family protein [Hyphomicrobiales bacterium]